MAHPQFHPGVVMAVTSTRDEIPKLRREEPGTDVIAPCELAQNGLQSRHVFPGRSSKPCEFQTKIQNSKNFVTKGGALVVNGVKSAAILVAFLKPAWLR